MLPHSGCLWPPAPDWDRRADVVGRALRLIADGVVDREGVAGLARRLGCGPRQLHGQLVAAVGAGPLGLARAQRAQIARQLLETTPLSIPEVAFAAGFGSVRQFNQTLREAFALPPTILRSRARARARARAGAGRPARGEVVLRLPFRAPLEGEGLIRFLALRSVPGVEEVIDGTYRRSLRLPIGAGVVELEPLEGYVQARYILDDVRDLAPALQRSRALLDLDSDPQPVIDALGADRLLGALVRAAPGLRVLGHVDAHELAVRAVLGQQVSLASAATLAARLVTQQGEPLARPVGTVTHLFPSAQVLAAVEPDRLAMPGSRRAALLALSRALASGELILDPGADRELARRRLLALPGIGPWTVGYVAMRGLRDPDAFLPTDLGVRHALAELGADGRPASAAALAASWRPYRAYALMHLWALLAPARRAPAAPPA